MDFVAEAGCLLELELACGVFHAFFQILQVSREIVADQMAGFLVAGIDGGVILFANVLHDIADILAHAFRRDAVGDIKFLLFGAPAVGFLDRLGQRIGHIVGVENDAAVDVASGAADGLDERGARA